MMIFVFIVVY